MIHKHEIPILEFDDNPQAVIMPTHEDLGLDLPARCVYGFLEEEVEIGLLPYIQAMLLARHLRGDLAEYPPFLMR